jgi:hypothetical protein
MVLMAATGVVLSLGQTTNRLIIFQLINNHVIMRILILIISVLSEVFAADVYNNRKDLIAQSMQRNISEAYFDYARKFIADKLRPQMEIAIIAVEAEFGLEWLLQIERTEQNFSIIVLIPEKMSLRFVPLDKPVASKLPVAEAFAEIGELASGQSGFKPQAGGEDLKSRYSVRSLASAGLEPVSRLEVGIQLDIPASVATIVEVAKAELKDTPKSAGY